LTSCPSLSYYMLIYPPPINLYHYGFGTSFYQLSKSALACTTYINPAPPCLISSEVPPVKEILPLSSGLFGPLFLVSRIAAPPQSYFSFRPPRFSKGRGKGLSLGTFLDPGSELHTCRISTFPPSRSSRFPGLEDFSRKTVFFFFSRPGPGQPPLLDGAFFSSKS